MNAKHTPGPWYSQRTTHDVLIASEDPATNGRTLAVVPGEDAEAKATARLIAAAPELAEALRRLADRVEQIERPDGSTPDTLEARALLARIEGGDDEDDPEPDAYVASQEAAIEDGQARWSETGSTRKR